MSASTTDLINGITENIVNPLIVFGFSLGIVIFLWGVFQYVRKADEPEERTKAGQHILWGVVGLAIMMSAFGIVRFVTGTFGFDNAPVDNVDPFK